MSRAEYLYGQLRDVGVNSVDEATLVGKIVSGLPRKYMSFMSNWSSTDPKKQTINELLPRLMAEEKLMQKFQRKPEGLALVGESSDKSKSKNKNNKNNKQSQNKSNKSRKKNDKKQFKCYHCHEVGHIRKECPERKNGTKNDEKSEVCEEKLKEATAIVAESYFSESCAEWILDSGASEHMSFERQSFRNYVIVDPPRLVRFGNHQYAQGVGIGDIPVRASLSDGRQKELILKEVLHVPKIRRKLVSVSSITDKGNVGEIKGNSIVIKDQSGGVLFEATKRGKIYTLPFIETVSEANVAEDSDALTLWHRRLAHINKRTILKMAEAGSAEGLEIGGAKLNNREVGDHIDCLSCGQAKMARRSFPPSTRERSNRPGEVIHVDICGPVGATTVAGSNYFALFKDEHSNFRHIYFVKSRDEVYNCIRDCFNQVKVDTGNAVRCLVSDCGSEFVSKRTQEFLAQSGAIHRTSAPFVPAQNGFIERDNRTVMEAARAMLYQNKLPEKLWGEAANAAVYILNRTANRNTGDQTPFELYHSKKPRLSHIRVFGCLALMKAQEKKRSGYQRKLDPRGVKTILVGFERDYTYRLYEPTSNKVIIARDVSLDESQTLEAGETQEEYEFISKCIDDLPDVESGDDVDDEIGRDAEANLARQNSRSEDQATEALFVYGDEPSNFREALSSEHSREWVKSMDDEYESLVKNKTWSLVKLPAGRTPITCKWVYKLKRNTDGSVARFKSRLVARGYSQKKGIDYKETFSPVARLESIRLILAVAAAEDMEMVHFDVRTAFLHGNLEEEIYMNQPEGYEKDVGLVCKLEKSLYGLKQASRAWNLCFTNFLKEFSLQSTYKDDCVFVKKESGIAVLIIALYVDDGLICSTSRSLLNDVVAHLRSKFEVTTLDPKCFVGLQIERDRANKESFIHQQFYINKVVRRFELQNSKEISTPADSNQILCKDGTTDGRKHVTVSVPYREAIGSLVYVSNGTRPDIAFIVGKLASYCEEPKLVHWTAVKRVIGYC